MQTLDDMLRLNRLSDDQHAEIAAWVAQARTPWRAGYESAWRLTLPVVCRRRSEQAGRQAATLRCQRGRIDLYQRGGHRRPLT